MNYRLTQAVQGVMSPARIMAANRLATEARAWSRLLARGNSPEKSNRSSTSRQWLSVRPRDSTVWVIEQHPAITHAADYSEYFARNGYVLCHGDKLLGETRQERRDNESSPQAISDAAAFFRDNVTSVEAVRKLMRGVFGFVDEGNVGDTFNNGSSTVNSLERMEYRVPYGIEPLGKFVYRADLENSRKPLGVIDTKISIAMGDGLESFEATSGPPFDYQSDRDLAAPFDWSRHFANVSHIGQPEKFAFESVVPQWIWP